MPLLLLLLTASVSAAELPDDYVVDYEFVSQGNQDVGRKWKLGLTVKELRELGYELSVDERGEHVIRGRGKTLVGRDGILPLIQEEHMRRYTAYQQELLDKQGDHYEIQNYYYPDYPSHKGRLRIWASVRELRKAGLAPKFTIPGAPPSFVRSDGRLFEVGSREWAIGLTKVWLDAHAQKKQFRAGVEAKLRRFAAGLDAAPASAGANPPQSPSTQDEELGRFGDADMKALPWGPVTPAEVKNAAPGSAASPQPSAGASVDASASLPVSPSGHASAMTTTIPSRGEAASHIPQAGVLDSASARVRPNAADSPVPAPHASERRSSFASESAPATVPSPLLETAKRRWPWLLLLLAAFAAAAVAAARRSSTN